MIPFRNRVTRFSSRWCGLVLLAAVIVAITFPALNVQAATPPAHPPQSTNSDGMWNLKSIDESDSWEGPNFHGLESEYEPFINSSSLGATYTEYNIQFTPNSPRSISSKLMGTCSWIWPGGDIPSSIIPGEKYPYTLSVNGNITGASFFRGTVNGYTLDSQKKGSISFSQVDLDFSGKELNRQKETSAVLELESGKKEGEQRSITLQCQIDIVTVKAVYTYKWEKSGCTATLELPDNMKPGEKFTPQVTVVDNDGDLVTPKKEAWYYNGKTSGKTMTWDGKAGLVEYRYICPGEKQTKSVKLNISAIGACKAKITLPDDLKPGQKFSPNVVVTNEAGDKVEPKDGKWFYNGEESGRSMTWNGSAAVVSYQYICPLDKKSGIVKVSIKATEFEPSPVLVGGLTAVIAAGLATAAVGAALMKGSGKKAKEPPPTRYAMSVSRRYIEVKPKETQALTVQVWRIAANGSVSLASNASINIHIPATPGGLTGSSTTGFGRLVCNFSIPKPTVCETIPVEIIALADKTKVSTLVNVKIVPVYKLELEWRDPQKTNLPADGKEIYAWARLTATPLPDADSTPDNLARLIDIALIGPNSANVEMRSAPPESNPPFVFEGALVIPLRLASMPGAPGDPILRARYSSGNQVLDRNLAIGLEKELMLGAWVQGKKQADVHFNKNLSAPAWDFSEIIAYFHEPKKDGVPVDPPFEYELDANSLEFDPPVLQVNDIYQHASHQYTLKVTLKDDIDLDQFFGPHLQELNGIIQVKITVRDRNNEVYQTRLGYKLRPQLELFSDLTSSFRFVKGLDLKKNQLIADSDDQLKVVIGCCRSDRPEPRNLDYTPQADPAWWTLQGVLQGDFAGDYKSAPPEEADSGEKSLLIKSLKPILFKPERVEDKLVLQVEGIMTGELPSGYLNTPLKLDVELKALLPNLRLWVVPGKERGVSEAWAFAFLGNDTHKPLADTVLKITTESVTGGAPALLTNSGQNETSVITGEDGSEQADLVYSGMDWGNYEDALFIVRCCITNRTGDISGEAVKAAINIKENVKKCLADLFANSSALKLNNPCFEGAPLMEMSCVVRMMIFRPFLRGALWNIMERWEFENAFARGDKKAKFPHDFVCSEFRNRICEWLIRRRHYTPGQPDSVKKMASMNGIEFDNFNIANEIHNYEALFLSGMEPTADPRGLDPWWKQHWKDPAVLELDGLLSNNWERYYCLEAAWWLTNTTVQMSILAIFHGGGVVAVLAPFIGPLIGAYAAATTGALTSDRAYSDQERKYVMNRKDRLYRNRQNFLKDWVEKYPNG